MQLITTIESDSSDSGDEDKDEDNYNDNDDNNRSDDNDDDDDYGGGGLLVVGLKAPADLLLVSPSQHLQCHGIKHSSPGPKLCFS